VVQSQPGQIVPETLSLKNPSLKRLVEWLKIIEKKKKRGERICSISYGDIVTFKV
jgi:hypothetical protein